MKILLPSPLEVPLRLTTGHSQSHPTRPIEQSMRSRHTCLCCSHTLLRHIRLGVIYWRCSNCYQEMPVGSLVVAVQNLCEKRVNDWGQRIPLPVDLSLVSHIMSV